MARRYGWAPSCQETQPGRRLVQINSADSSAVQLGEWLAIGWLTPAMDRLFTDSAGARRRFVDRMALAIDPAHAGYATRYENALRERNRLLGEDHMPEAAWFDAIEREVAEHGAALSASRARTVVALSETLAALPDAPFARPELAIPPGGPADPDTLAGALRDGRRRDRAAGRTLTGPHRDELEVTHGGKGHARGAMFDRRAKGDADRHHAGPCRTRRADGPTCCCSTKLPRISTRCAARRCSTACALVARRCG